jgi:predicted metal-dependent hydrolase
MPEVTIGPRVIEYDIRRSLRARRKRIEVTPDRVVVVVPEDAQPDDVRQFVESRRRWLHYRTEQIGSEVRRLRAKTPQGFHSGAKVLFRGRHLKLRIETGDVPHPTLTYRTGFNVLLPRDIPRDDHETIARSLLEAWLEERLHEDAWEVIRRRGIPNGLEPRDVRIKDQRTLWGSCGRDRILRLDRKLARVPKPVFEYVVVHEVCHLRHRDHSPKFWALVKRLLPDFEERKDWLERHEIELG